MTCIVKGGGLDAWCRQASPFSGRSFMTTARLTLRHLLLPALLTGLMLAGQAQAVLITRSINVDGLFTDWDGTGASYVPAGDITTNSGQFNTDCESASACERDGALSSTGRDLKKFAFTWDSSYLYFYVERWVTASNATDWWFYMDTSGDGRMQTGEKVVHVKWTGSNGTTVVSIDDYNAAASGGDPVTSPVTGFADGYTMPGSMSNEVTLYSGHGGDTSTSQAGLRMEVAVPWSALGSTGPTNMTFHISSSNGSNLPNSVIDNMDGPSGNQLFPSDIQVSKSASQGTLGAGAAFTYTVTVRNLGYQPFAGVVLSDVLPAQVSYVSSSATAGSYTDSNGDGIPDRWNIGTLAAQQVVTLTVNAQAGNVTATTTVINTAALAAFSGLDSDASNNSASASVTITPSPLLSVTKVSSASSAGSGQVVSYIVNIANTGYGIATAVSATDSLSPFTALGINTFGAGQPFRIIQGSPASGLSLGTPSYSNNGGATYTYTPVSGGGGAPAGYDANITNFVVPFTGTMGTSGANLQLQYNVIVH